MISGAGFSECRAYRYALWRRWDWQGYANQVMFVGLNPSTADETEDDPTIRRCIRFAKDWGCGSLLMLNAYAWRATKPRDLHAYGGYADAIGPDNDEALAYRASQAGLIVAAWGSHCPKTREERVCEIIGRTIHCLGRTKVGRPRHPLYLRADTPLEVFYTPDSNDGAK